MKVPVDVAPSSPPLAPGSGDPSSLSTARYTVLGEFARGGLGRVFSATDDSLGRPVAIKQLLATTADARARFDREAKITARLQHSGVVPVYDAGQWSNGEPFFVMKMVEGRTLAELIDDTPAADDRLALLPRALALVETMAYAHSQGVIHRDLKPSNVVISPYGETVVIDWGLARVLGQPDDAQRTTVTDQHLDLSEGRNGGAMTTAGQVLGTPQFMPIEQAEGGAVDERADVYALGAILYNVLAGREPYAGVPKSELLQQVRSASPRPLAEVAPQAPDDLVALVDKAMARDRRDRYASARELAQDLRRFLDGQLVSAHRYSTRALFGRWLRRHRSLVAVTSMLLTALVVGGVVSVRRIVRERNTALRAEREVAARENSLVFLQAERGLADDPTATLAWLKRYRPAPLDEWRGRTLAEEAVALGTARHVIRFESPSRVMKVAPDAPLMVAGSIDGAVRLYHLETGAMTELGRHGAPVVALGFSPRGGFLASLDTAGTLRLWDVARRQRIADIQVGRANAPNLIFSDDGRRLAASGGGAQVWLISLDGARERKPIDLAAPSASLCFLRNGTLVTSDRHGGMMVLDTGAAKPRALPGLHPDARLSCLPDGRFVSAGVDGQVRIWNTRTGDPHLLGRHDDWVSAIMPSPDGSHVITASGDDTVRIFGTAGQGSRLLAHQADTIWALALSRDGRLLATANYESVELWDVESGELVRKFRAAQRGWNRLGISSDGRWLVASGLEEARVWPLDMLRSQILRGHTDLMVDLDWSSDGRWLASGARDKTVRLWNLAGGPPWTSPPLDSWVMRVRFIGRDRLFVFTRAGRSLLYDLSTHQAQEISAAGNGWPVLSADSSHAAFADGHGIVVDDLNTRRRVRLPVAAQVPDVEDLAFTADGRRLAVALTTGSAELWDIETERRLFSHRFPDRIAKIVVAADPLWVAVINAHKQILLWDPKRDRVLEVPGADAPSELLSFTNHQRSLAYIRANQIGLYDLATGTTRVLLGHRANVVDVATHDSLMVTADAQGYVRLWDQNTAATAVLYRELGPTEGLRFSDDGRHLATSGPDRAIHLWNLDGLPLATPLAHDKPWLETLTTATIDQRQAPRTP